MTGFLRVKIKGERMLIEVVKKIVLPLVVLIAVLGIWNGISSVVDGFPTPTDTYISAFGGVDADGEEIDGVLADPFYIEDEEDKGLFWHMIESLKRVFGGFSLALIMGIPLGLLVGMSDNAKFAFDPFIQILKSISPLAWLPLLLFIFSDINMTMISTVFITSSWPILVYTALGVRSVSEDYMNVAKVLRFTTLEKILQIILPVAVPYIFRGMRLSLGIAWLVIVGAEMLTGGIGMGSWIWNAYDELEYAHIIIGIILVGLIGFMLDLMMRQIDNFFDYTKRGRA